MVSVGAKAQGKTLSRWASERRTKVREAFLGKVCQVPDDWADGDRRRGGVSRMQAFAWNCRNQSSDGKGEAQATKIARREYRKQSRGGPIRISNEGPVMGLELKVGPDLIVAAGELGTAVTLILFWLARVPITALAASLIAGVSWIAVLASLNVSAQLALPDWVRGRGLAMYVTVFLWIDDGGKHTLRRNRRHSGIAVSAFHRGGRCDRRRPLDVEMEATNRSRDRPYSLHALAHTHRLRRCRWRSWASPRDRRIPR